MDIVNRIFDLLEKSELNQNKLAALIGVKKNTISRWKSGELKSYTKYLPQIAETLGTTVEYLVTGNVEPDMPQPSVPHGMMVPVLGDVAGGVPMLAVENIIDYEEVDVAMAGGCDLIGLRVNGHSMEPRICDGDVVIVRLQSDVDTGSIAVVIVNGDSATLKRIKKEPDGSIWLLPSNPVFSAVHYSPKEQEALPVKIIGKVIELRGKFN